MPALYEFHRHPDDLVYVRANGVNYVDTPENFAADFGETLSPMPAEADEQIYTQGRRHAFMGNGNIVDGGPMPWEQGDRIIASIEAGLFAQSSRREAERATAASEE